MGQNSSTGEPSKAQAHAAERQKAQEALETAYDRFRRDQARDLYSRLPEAERAAIDAEVRQKSAGLGGALAERMLDIRRGMITAKRHTDKIMTFEDWRTSLGKA